MIATDPYVDWDAAYVLGALDPAERREFERHLAACPNCAARVGEIAGMPGWLARLPADEAERVAAQPVESPPPAHLNRLLQSARDRRHRNRRRTVIGIGVAAVLVVATVLFAGGLAGGWWSGAHPSTVTVSLEAEAPVPISADVRLVPTEWGTDVSTHCRYPLPEPGAPVDERYDTVGHFGLYVTDDDGSSTMVSSWRAAPGSDVRASGSTDVTLDRIARVDIRAIGTGTVLLESPVDAE